MKGLPEPNELADCSTFSAPGPGGSSERLVRGRLRADEPAGSTLEICPEALVPVGRCVTSCDFAPGTHLPVALVVPQLRGAHVVVVLQRAAAARAESVLNRHFSCFQGLVRRMHREAPTAASSSLERHC